MSHISPSFGSSKYLSSVSGLSTYYTHKPLRHLACCYQAELFHSSIMALSAWGIFFGVMGNITASLLFVSPIPTFWRIVKSRSTEDFESVPYIILFLNASLWTYYGLLTPNGVLLVSINGFGATLQAIFICIFLIFAPVRMKVKTAVLVVVLDMGVLVGAILVTRLTMEIEAQIDTVGSMCTFVTIISFASPLAAMKTVVLTRSVEYMPFFLSFFYFLTAFMWTIYAILTRDIFILIPNVTGFVLGVSQLVVYAIYRNGNPSTTKSADDTLEEGCPTEPLIPSSQSIS